MPLSKLTASQIKPLLTRLNDELGKADQQRVQMLLDVHTESTLNYASAIHTLFPDQTQEKAQNSFRSFRNRLNNAAEEIGVLLKLEVDSHKRSAASERECWFEGEDSKVAQIAQYSSEEASDQDSEKLVPAHGRVVGKSSKENPAEKPLIKLFISYARKDNRDTKKVSAFFDELNECFKASKHFRYELWADWEILIGEDWHSEIIGALDQCDFGLMMVSLPFINSDYISQHELPDLLSTSRALPVAFKKFDINSFELKGLKPQQIFRHNDKFYSQFTGGRKADFIQALFHDIEKRIQKLQEQAALTKAKEVTPTNTIKALELDPTTCSAEDIARAVKAQTDKDFDPDHHTESRGRPVGIKTAADLVKKEKMEADENAVIATEYLMDWASNTESPPFCAVLGEYGMGKTTTLKAFTRQLLEQRLDNTALPLPIYIDLREYTWDKQVDFDLHGILSHILKKSWKGGHATAPINPEDIINQVQENRALMIWDGLDEVIVHMEPKYANDFIRQLGRILPPLKQDKTQNPNAGKMLISCRSHYFRDINQQNSMLTSEHRDGIKGEDYEALILLPFGQSQIETYLQKSLKLCGVDLHKTLDLISSVHNLPEMAERPYTLSLISQHIPQIEELSLRGEIIQGVTLYKSMVENWLTRDTGKHQFSTHHKKQLMEYLAAALWRNEQRQWTVDELDEWLDDFLYNNPRIADAYRNMDREVLKEDLRTATFITRPDDRHFRFAHTSLQEFFLASYLHRGLYEKKRENWQLFSESNSTLPSHETFDFMVQLYTSEPQRQTKCKQSMVLWLNEHEAQSSKLLFKVWLMLAERDEIIPYKQLTLPQTDLSHWVIKGSAQRNLIIHNADLSHAKLDHIVFDYVQFRNCNFNRADLWLAEFQHCQFSNCQFEETKLTASLWRHNDLFSLNIQHACIDDSQWIDNENQHDIWQPSLTKPQRFVDRLKPINKTLLAYRTTGHSAGIISIAFSPDGKHIASGANDNTIKLWDAHNGHCAHSFEGHAGAVHSVAFSPDGKYIVSGANDRTIKLWDAHNGHCTHSFEGHADAVRSVALSPDGKYIASGAEGNTIKLWDAHNGHCAHSFEGHSDAVRSVVFSPDGKYIASGAYDNTIKLWDAHNGHCTHSFEGHTDWVQCVAFSPDGKYIASGADDHTIKLWDTHSGHCTHSFEGHSFWVQCVAFSPDGKHIASGAYDHTIKLWNTHNGHCTHSFEGHAGAVHSVAFSPDGKHIASGAYDHTIKLWNTHNGHCTHSFEGHAGAVHSVAFSPDGKHIASGADNTIKLWDAHNGHCAHSFERHTGWVQCVAFSPDGKYIASGADDHTIKLWDTHSGHCTHSFEGHTDMVLSVAFSPDGKYIASGANDSTIKVWDTHNGHCTHSLEGHAGSVRSVAFSPDGKHIASGASDSNIKIWDTHKGHCTHSFEGHIGSVRSVAFSPDGKHIASSASDNTIKLWGTHNSNYVHSFEGHTDSVISVAFSPDGKYIASGADDNTIKLWDIKSKELLTSSYHLPRNNTTTVDALSSRIIYGSAEAWRYFCYKDPAESISEGTLYPAEVYGPLPGHDG